MFDSQPKPPDLVPGYDPDTSFVINEDGRFVHTRVATALPLTQWLKDVQRLSDRETMRIAKEIDECAACGNPVPPGNDVARLAHYAAPSNILLTPQRSCHLYPVRLSGHTVCKGSPEYVAILDGGDVKLAPADRARIREAYVMMRFTLHGA